MLKDFDRARSKVRRLDDMKNTAPDYSQYIASVHSNELD